MFFIVDEVNLKEKKIKKKSRRKEKKNRIKFYILFLFTILNSFYLFWFIM